MQALKDKKEVGNLPAWHPGTALKNQWNHLSIDHENLVLFESRRLLVPDNLVPEIIKKCHSIHQGIAKTKKFAISKFFWPNMNRDISNAVEKCKKCLLYLPSQSPEPLIPSLATRAMQIIDTDCFEVNGTYYVVAVDRFSSFLWCKKIPNLTSRAVIKFLENIFLEHGYAQIIYSDGAGAYSSQEFENFVTQNGMTQKFSSPRHPSSNAVAESAVRNAKRLVQKTDSYDDFQKALSRFRCCPMSDGKSPASVFYQRKPRDSSIDRFDQSNS